MNRQERRAGARRRNIWSIAGLIGLATAGALGAAVLARASAPVEPLDRDLCPLARPITDSTMVIIDPTSRLTPQQQQEAAEAIRAAARTSPLYAKLVLLVLTGRAHELDEKLSLCSPKPPFPVNIWTQTPRFVMAHWNRQFGEPVEATLRSLGDLPPAAESPLVEGIATLPYRRDFGPNVPNRHVLIVSDLMQHARHGPSLYAGRRIALGREQPDLRGVDVDIVLLLRPEVAEQQLRVAVPLWCDWLQARGARVSVNSNACPVTESQAERS